MDIRALKFVTGADRAQALLHELQLNSAESFLKGLAHDGPAAFVVRHQDLQLPRTLKAVISDCGIKHPATSLWEELRTQGKVPLIAGTYTRPGRLVQGVTDLLKQAVDHGERKAYIIGTDERIFEKLWKEHEDAPWNATQQRLQHEPCAGDSSPQALLDLLPTCDVPEDLAGKFIGVSLEAQVVRQLIVRAASSRDEVLILGDTGTGKDVVARCIHQCSGRQPFIAVKCNAIPEERFDTVLFGCAKSAFPAATEARDGQWKIAGSGTLLLDDISELRPEHQAQILQALETKTITPVGGDRQVPVTARVLAASNRDLFFLMQAGRFNSDLYYRLRAFTLRVPPLHERPEDIPLLARKFWCEITWDEDSRLPPEIESELQLHRWPGNVRELKAVLSALHALFGKDHLRVQHLRAVLGNGSEPLAAPLADRTPSFHHIDYLRHLRRLEEVLRACDVTLRPLTGEEKAGAATVEAVESALRHRLHELELLCRDRALFHDTATFENVSRVKRELSRLRGMLEKNPADALRHWNKGVAGQLERALSTISDETERVMKGL